MNDTTARSHKHPNLNEFIRGWNDTLCLWKLCRRGKCFNSRTCFADDARRCFHTHIVLLPAELQAWMNAIMSGAGVAGSVLGKMA